MFGGQSQTSSTSFNAIHWLDRLPAVPLTDFVAYRRPLATRTGLAVSPPAATAAFTRQAEQDLVRFLECRARELVHKGRKIDCRHGSPLLDTA